MSTPPGDTQPGSDLFTVQELRMYNGSDPSRSIYISVNSKVYDVTSARDFYGPNSPYSVFAGEECGRALALMSKKKEHMGLKNCDDLTDSQKKTLDDWIFKFDRKYPTVGRLINS